MPKRVVPLTDLQVRNARAEARTYRLFDGSGLYLEVSPSGSKLWKFAYFRLNGRETRISFGTYPEVSLSLARERRAEARRQLSENIDPKEAREAVERAEIDAAGQTFEKVTHDWHATMKEQWQPGTAANILHRFEVDIFPEFGHLRIGLISPADILRAIRAIEKRGALEIAKRMKADVARVFDFAYHAGLVARNPAATLSKVLKPRGKGHYAAIGADELPKFIRTLTHNDACMGPIVRIAMRLMLLIFVRTSELIETPWSEINLETGEWVIPWQRMKRGKRKVNPDTTDHHVCLSRQALELLRELHSFTGGGRLLFPNSGCGAAHEQYGAAGGAQAHGISGRYDRAWFSCIGDEYLERTAALSA